MNSERIQRGLIGVAIAWAASFMGKAFFPSAIPWWDLVRAFMDAAPFFVLVVAYGLAVSFLIWTASGGKASLVALAACGALFGPGASRFCRSCLRGFLFFSSSPSLAASPYIGV